MEQETITAQEIFEELAKKGHSLKERDTLLEKVQQLSPQQKAEFLRLCETKRGELETILEERGRQESKINGKIPVPAWWEKAVEK